LQRIIAVASSGTFSCCDVHLPLQNSQLTHPLCVFCLLLATGVFVCVARSPKDTLGNQLSAKVLKKVFNNTPVFYRDGGTIPALAYFQSILGVDTTGFGFGLGDHIHAPNERTPVAQYHIGRTAYVEMLAELGNSWPADAVKSRGSRRKKPSVSGGSKVSRQSSSSKPAAWEDFADEFADAYDSTDSKQEL
jgi:hypothetical protein